MDQGIWQYQILISLKSVIFILANTSPSYSTDLGQVGFSLFYIPFNSIFYAFYTTFCIFVTYRTFMFEFDKNKSESNKRKHGIDFETARRLWVDFNRVEIPTKWIDESRILLIANLEEEIWAAIFTHRKNTTRIISVRKARTNEKEIYNSRRI